MSSALAPTLGRAGITFARCDGRSSEKRLRALVLFLVVFVCIRDCKESRQWEVTGTLQSHIQSELFSSSLSFLWSLISEIDGPPGRQNWTELCHLWRRRFRLSYARAGELGGKALPHCTLNQEEQQGATILKQETIFIILTDS